MSMDKGPDVLYYLSNHPDEAATIVNSGAQKATLALGRIEAKFMLRLMPKNSCEAEGQQSPASASRAARGTGGGLHLTAPDTDDLDAFSQFFKKSRK
jgi:hypothetical protein